MELLSTNHYQNKSPVYLMAFGPPQLYTKAIGE